MSIPDHDRKVRPKEWCPSRQARTGRKYNGRAMRNKELLLHQNTMQYHLERRWNKFYCFSEQFRWKLYSPSGWGAKNLRTQLVFNCVKALVSCNGKTWTIKPDSCHAATILWPSSTFAIPWNAVTSSPVALNPCSTWNTSHCLSCELKSATLPSSSLICSKQWLSRVVNSRNAPPRSDRNRFGRRYSSAALKRIFVGADT